MSSLDTPVRPDQIDAKGPIQVSNVMRDDFGFEIPVESVPLPSRGVIYSEGGSLFGQDTVDIKPMTAKEEDILTSQNLLRKGIAIDKLLESLVIDKNIDLDSMLSGDKSALIFASRRLAYGDSYGPLDVTCPACNEKAKVTIDLSELKYKETSQEVLPDENGEFSYKLPNSKVSIKIKLLTSGDEKIIEKNNQSMSKIKAGVTNEVTGRLKYMITEINGERNKAEIVKFVENSLLSKDSFELRKFLKEISPDIENTFEFTCDSCQSEERIFVPITAQFFWPDSAI